MWGVLTLFARDYRPAFGWAERGSHESCQMGHYDHCGRRSRIRREWDFASFTPNPSGERGRNYPRNAEKPCESKMV